MTHFRHTLLQELTSVVEGRATALTPRQAVTAVPGRRGLARLSAAVAGIAVLSIAASVALVGRSAPQAFAVTRLPDGRIEISVQEDFDDAAALEAELLAAGIEVEVEEVPASPSMVGKVADAYFLDPETGYGGETGVFSQNAGNAVFEESLVVDPAATDDILHLAVGVATPPEQFYGYGGAASPFAPGEALDGLHCVLGEEPHTVGELAPHLERLGLRVDWHSRLTEPGELYGAMEPHAGVPPLGEEVEWVELASPETVTVASVDVAVREHFDAEIGDAVAIIPDPMTGEWIPASELPTLAERFPCTPELAARWE